VAYQLYGASAADFFADLKPDGSVIAVPGATATVSATNGGPAIPDLRDTAGQPATQVVADGAGNFQFLAPDTYGTLWIKPTSVGSRYYPVQPAAVGDLAKAASDGVKALTGTVSQQTVDLATLSARVPQLGTRYLTAPANNPTVPSIPLVAADGTVSWVALASLGGTDTGTPTPVTVSDPTGVTITAGATPGTYRLTWNPVSGASGYDVSFATGTDVIGVQSAGGASLTTFNTGVIASGTTIRLGVNAYKTAASTTVRSNVIGSAWITGNSIPTPSVAGHLSTPGAASTVAVSNFRTSAVTDTTATFSWTAPSDTSKLTGYTLAFAGKTVTLASNATTYQSTGLAASTAYPATLTPIVSAGATPVPATLSVTTAATQTAPTVPSTAVTAPGSAFTYVGTWGTGSAGEYYTHDTTGSATLTFTGTYVELTALKDAHHTAVNISIDGGTAVAVSEQADTRGTAVIFTRTGLASGTHTIKLTPAAADTPTVTVISARVTAYTASTAGGGTNTGGGTTTPATTTPVNGVVYLNTTKAGLLLNGKEYKSVGWNAVNMLGPTNAQRQITDDAAYYKNYAAGMTDRVWALPGCDLARLDRIIQYAGTNGARLVVTLYDALGSGGPNWDTLKSNFGSYQSHITDIVTKYRNNPTIMAWEVANEPPQDKAGIKQIADAIKANDSTHLVSTGTNATYSDSGVPAFADVASIPSIDILSMHEYDSLVQGASPHLQRILSTSTSTKKPIIIGEFGIDANSDGSGTGNTGHNGATTFAGRAKLIGQKAAGYLGTSQVAGIFYWSIGQNSVYTSADSYMWLGETAGVNAMKAASAQYSKNAN